MFRGAAAASEKKATRRMALREMTELKAIVTVLFRLWEESGSDGTEVDLDYL